MILNKQGESFWYEGKEYRVGEWVVGNEKSEYQGLYGKITQIRDGDDKEMENQFPDMKWYAERLKGMCHPMAPMICSNSLSV